MKQHVSISRLHKLADRLKAKVAELNAEAETALSAQNWRSGTITQAQMNRATEQAEQGYAALAQAEQLSRELARIRAIIATQNERLGINAKLGLQDVLNRQLSALKSVVVTGGALMRDELEVGQSTGDYGLAVVAHSSEQVQGAKQSIARLQREIFGLSDEVAEANATRIELELSDEVAALITG